MPLYEYECPEHGKFEAQKPIAERVAANCPQCGRIANKIMSACNWSFGWRLSDRSHEVGGPRDEYVKNV